MYLLANFEEPESTRAALLSSALELLAEKGYKGAITREIAARAGVSEVTLFRLYKNKEALLREAVQKLRPPIEKILPKLSGDLEADLLHMAQNYVGLLEANQGLVMRLLPELTRHPELHGELGPQGLKSAMSAGFGFIASLQQSGLLHSNETPVQATLAFLGPLFAHKILFGGLGVQIQLDLRAYVRGFLQGRRKHG